MSIPYVQMFERFIELFGQNPPDRSKKRISVYMLQRLGDLAIECKTDKF